MSRPLDHKQKGPSPLIVIRVPMALKRRLSRLAKKNRGKLSQFCREMLEDLTR